MKTKMLVLTLAFTLSLVVAGLALANATIVLPRWVLGSGATDATAGNVALRGTLGQPVVGVVSGGDVSLGQGIWHGVSFLEGEYYTFLPLVLK